MYIGRRRCKGRAEGNRKESDRDIEPRVWGERRCKGRTEKGKDRVMIREGRKNIGKEQEKGEES